MRVINESKASHDQDRKKACTGVAVGNLLSQCYGFAVSTESIPLERNVDDLLVRFLRSRFISGIRRAAIHFRVRLGQPGVQARSGSRSLGAL